MKWPECEWSDDGQDWEPAEIDDPDASRWVAANIEIAAHGMRRLFDGEILWSCGMDCYMRKAR